MLARRSLGCLTGCLTRLLLLLVAGVVLFVAIDYVFAPWAFYLGGRFHPYPGWQGIGTMHADAGDYVLYVWITPQPSGRGSLIHLPYLRGWGSLCTPKGERFPMRLSAGMNAHPGRDTNGLEVNMDMYLPAVELHVQERRPAPSAVAWPLAESGPGDGRPRHPVARVPAGRQRVSRSEAESACVAADAADRAPRSAVDDVVRRLPCAVTTDHH